MGSFQASGQSISGIISVAEGSTVPDSLLVPRGTGFHPDISSLGDWGDDRPSAGGAGLVFRRARK